jgi:hypothetical protein
VHAATNDHRSHRKEHGPERWWKHLCLENFRALNDLWASRQAGHKILHLLASADEIEHRHALRQRHEECCKKTKKYMLR